MTRMLAATGIGEGRGVERAGLALLVFVCAAGALQPFYAVRLRAEEFENMYIYIYISMWTAKRASHRGRHRGWSHR